MTSNKPRDPNALPATISNAESPTLPPSGHQADVVKPPAVIEETIATVPSRGDEATMPPTASQQPLSAVGTKVRYFGDYELLEEIARGGMGVVYKARQVSLNRVVALKMILSGQLAGKDDVQRFHAEAEAAANLDHPGIVPIYEVGEYEGMHYFSMALVDGGSLASKLKDGPLPPQAAAEYTQKVTAAIAFAHGRGVIHRDLKPANVLLDRHGEPKVTDFGLAKQVQGDSHLTTTGQILGTPSYMPPEQAAGKIAEIGPAADIYSLGAILYALLTGRPPFQSDNPMDTLLQVLERDPVPPRQLNSKLPADLETICLKCLEKSPDRRYRSGETLSEELGRYLRGEPILARPISSVERGWRWCKRKPVIAGLVAAIAMLFLIGTTIATFAAIKFKTLAEQERQTAANEREASLAAEAARKTAETERNLARTANERSLDALAASHYQQAVAVRNSTEPSRRWRALELLKSAAVLRGRQRTAGIVGAESPQNSSRPVGQLPTNSDLRSEAVAALITQDARLVWECLSGLPGAEPASISPPALRAAMPFSRLTEANPANRGGVKLIDLTSGGEIDVPNNSQIASTTLALSPDGKTLASHSLPLSKGMPLWDLEQGKQIKTLPFPEELTKTAKTATPGSFHLEFAPDGKSLVAFYSPRQPLVMVWNIETGVARAVAAHNNVATATLSGDGKWLAHRKSNTTVALWDLSSEEEPAEVTLPWPTVNHFALSYAGDLLAISGSAAQQGGKTAVLLWDPRAKQARGELKAETAFRELAFSPDGNLLAAGEASGQVVFFDLPARKEKFRLRAHRGELVRLAWRADSRRLWTAGMDGSLKCWDLIEDPFSTELGLAALGPATQVAADPETGELAVAVNKPEYAIRRVNPNTHEAVRTYPVFKGKPRQSPQGFKIIFRKDGKQFALLTQRFIVGWDTATGEEIARFPADEAAKTGTTSAAFTESGQLVVAGYAAPDRNVNIWNAATGERLWQSKEGFVDGDLSPSADWIMISASLIAPQQVPLVFKVDTGDEVKLEGLEPMSTQGPVFSANGKWLAALGGTLRGLIAAAPGSDSTRAMGMGASGGYTSVWQLPAGKRKLQILGSDTPMSIAFSHDSRNLAVGYRDGSAELWNLDSGELLFRWKEHSGSIGMLSFARDGTKIISQSRNVQVLKLAAVREELAGIHLNW